MLDDMLFSRWVLLFSFSLGLHAASDPWIGTWRMDKAKSHSENFDLGSDLKLDITSEGDRYRLAFSMTDKDGKVERFVMTQPKNGGTVSVAESARPNQMDTVTVEVPDNHHWIYKYFKNGKLMITRYVTASADGRVHEAKATYMQDGKKVVEDEYMVKAD